MRPKRFCTIAFMFFVFAAQARSAHQFADSIRKAYNIPELGYAVVSSDSVLEMGVLGERKLLSNMPARSIDRFRIGSNTKLVTGLIAAMVVHEGKLSWNTKFFDMFPGMKAASRPEYHNLTLIDLLSFRTRLYSYTYTYPEPVKGQFKGSADSQRHQFARWFMQHAPVQGSDSINFSNLGYVAAGLMLEKASGKTYRQLVTELGGRIGVQFGFGRPNAADRKQTWGHGQHLIQESSAEDHKLDWLEAAGNINCTVSGFAAFVQLHLQGLQGRSQLLSAADFNYLLFGRPRFAVGWIPRRDDVYGAYSFHVGNPGTFLSKVYVYPVLDRAIILFTNAQTNQADEGTEVLRTELSRRYMRQR